MFPEVVRAVRELRPRAFIFENVRGLLFPRVRPYFDYILNQLRMPSLERQEGESWRAHNARLKKIPEERHEYRVYWQVLNAADFGLAQYRPRLVVVGARADEAGTFEWPEASHSRERLIDALHQDEYWDEHGVPQAVRERVLATLPPQVEPAESGERVDRWLTVRDVISDLGPFNGDPLHRLIPGARLYSKHTGSSLDWPAKTVKAGVNGCPGGEHIVRLDDGSHRYLSVRECAALQGFPRDYNFPYARTYTMRQIGNAVPIPLAEAIGNQVKEALNHGRT
jgi:DNA (cytosine-5)-methyltransferase 1